MRLRHPYSLEEDSPPLDSAVHWGGRLDVSEVDDDGTFEVPDDRASTFVESWPTAEGYDLDDLRVDVGDEEGGDDEAADDVTDDEYGTCQVVKNDGEVCGRDLPCRYHSDDGED